MKISRRTLLVVLAAALGIVLAAAITWGTSQLVRQHIGLASEPLTAGHRLLPSATSTAGPPTAATQPTTVTTTPATSATSSTSTAPPASGPPRITTTAPLGDGGDSGGGDD